MEDRPKGPTVAQKLGTEWNRLHAEIRHDQPLIEPTDTEKRNGWTAETLTAYVAERRTANELRVDTKSLHSKMGHMPVRQNKRPKGGGLLKWMR